MRMLTAIKTAVFGNEVKLEDMFAKVLERGLNSPRRDVTRPSAWAGPEDL